MYLLVQEEIRRGIDLDHAARKADMTLVSFSRDADLSALEREVAGDRVLVFCSLQIAARIDRLHPGLARGVLLPRRFLHHAVYTSCVPRKMLLNPRGVYLPWGRIPDMAETLEHLFTDGVFMRPDSPLKPFTGDAAEPGELRDFHDLMSRTLPIDAEEMTYVTDRKALPKNEWRCWIVDGSVPASAGYAWADEDVPGRPAPDVVLRTAHRLAAALERREQVFIADFVVLPGEGVKLVEINALSTSGWYPGTDVETLLRALDPVMM